MRRYILSHTEGKIRDALIAEYLDARRQRHLALGGIANSEREITTKKAAGGYTGISEIHLHLAHERLAVAREAIRLTTDLMRIVRGS